MSKMTQSTGKEFHFNGTFHEAVSSILVLAQCFACCPVIGVKSGSAYGLKFTWKSFRTLYAVAAFVFAASYTILAICVSLKRQVTFNSIVLLTFFITTACGVLSFIFIARKWPRLMKHWEFVEAILPSYQTMKEKQRLANKIRMISYIVLFVALAEHILNMVSIVMGTIKANPEKDALRELIQAQLPDIFTLTELTWWKAILSKWLVIVVTFTWSFMDLFVMIISVGLASQFEQINSDLQYAKGKHMSEGFWTLRRFQYRKVVHLCEAVDDVISQVTCIALANNLFFICVQIVRSLKTMPSFLNKLYFWFSLIFLIIRTIAVSLYASYIHDESKKPIAVLRAIPRYSWCEEAGRFSEEVVNGTVALTGMKFFFFKRTLILTVFATILTYVLVLLMQFNTDV